MAHPTLRTVSNSLRAHVRTLSRGRTLAALVAGLLALATLATPAPAFAEKTISLSAGTLNLSLPPGGTGAGGLTVSSTGTEKIRALVYVADARIDAKGMPVYTRPPPAQGPDPRSAATWVQLKMPESTKIIANTPYIELKAGESLPVAFSETVPSNARPGDYNAVIFFEMFEVDPTSPTGSVSKVTGRIGCRVVTHVRGQIHDSIEVRPFAVDGLVFGDSTPYAFTVTNDGNVDKRFAATLLLRDANGADVSKSVVASSAIVYAGDHINYSGVDKLTGAGLGRYDVVLRVDHQLVTRDETATAPETKSIEEVRSVWVVPWWILAVALAVLAVILLFIAWLIGRAARRSRTSKRAAQETGPPLG